MNTEHNIQTIKDIYAAFGSGNIPSLLEAVAEDFEWTDAGAPEIPYAGTYKGRSDFANFFLKMVEVTEVKKWAVNDLLANESKVIATGEFGVEVKATGKYGETPWVMVWEFKDGVPVKGNAFHDDLNFVKIFR